ncbi:MAG: lytic murein transglycosylase, partial [Solirubrobacteraceae bacterium]
GVPNFFIDSFRIPPFLIPIYQAAGIEYDIPWQVLAAINEIETDYGRNLSPSSAGAEGWMQFLPATWKVYGVDANGDGVKDPYNPVDAIFAAARYLNAAGAAKDLKSAIFAYNHASWYVDSVMLRAQLIGGLPDALVSSLSGLTQGRFPVLARSRYADDPAEATVSAAGHNAATNVSATAVNIYAKSGAPVIAAQDGVIVSLGSSATLGKYAVLRDSAGNTYTYSQLQKLATSYPQPKPHVQLAGTAANRNPALPGLDPAPQQPASDGFQAQTQQLATGAPASSASAAAATTPTPAAAPAAATGSLAPQRLFAHPLRPAAYAAGGKAQLARVLGLRASDVKLSPLRKGAQVTAGTILGRIGKSSPLLAPHLTFQVRPAGKSAPLIDPKPILDGWKLLESTAIYRAADKHPLLASQSPTIGQVLLDSKNQLQQRVLSDPNVDIYPCGRRDVESGQIDRRVLATLEFLSGSGLKPSVTGLKCGHTAVPGIADDAASGNGMDLSSINGIPIIGHQGAGSIADITVRRLLTLQGAFKPLQIVSLMQYPGVDNTTAMADHADRIHVGFSPPYDPSSKLGRQIAAALKPKQWSALVARLTQIQSPIVPGKPSQQAIPDAAPAAPPTG